tara:strand:- start:165 stop:419 length:255 start_codon:yes stop_codon:yes gene_type:complete
MLFFNGCGFLIFSFAVRMSYPLERLKNNRNSSSSMDSLGEVHRGMIDISVTIVDCRANNEEEDSDDNSTSESEVEEDAYNSESS